MNHLTIGQLAKQGGVNLETIRYQPDTVAAAIKGAGYPAQLLEVR